MRAFKGELQHEGGQTMLNLLPSHDSVQVAHEVHSPVWGDGCPPLPALDDCPAVSLPIASLVLKGSPRRCGEDVNHTRALADVHEPLPPITVHRRTMQVIDGMHRVRAALLNGRSAVDARLVECDEATALVLAVRVNVTHGLPLSTDDRKTAAVSIMRLHPQWSDRTIAASTGLSDKTVSALRSSATADSPQSHARVGRDGRVRPVNSGAMRREAAALIQARPEAGLREIARATGLSPATVRDVRQRTVRGEDPVPAKYRTPAGGLDARYGGTSRPPARPGPSAGRRRPAAAADRDALLSKLMNDPSMRFRANGRFTLRWLYHHALDAKTCQVLRTSVPDHWASSVAELARNCAQVWLDLADHLEQRAQQEDTG